MSATSFDQQSQLFLNWFRGLPGATFRDDIVIQDLRHRQAGRGIVAAADIEADSVLFTIPRKSILCAKTSAVVEKLPHVFAADEATDFDEDDDKVQDPWSSLILILIYEYLQGEASHWKPYFDVLPTEFDTPMFWSEDELKELQASSVVSRVGREQVSSMIDAKIIPVIRAHEDIFFSVCQRTLSNEELTVLAHRMGSTIMAYAFDMENDEDDEENQEDEWVEDKEGRVMMGMVPMADILNADAQFNAHINHDEDALTATALRPIKAGEEILNYYGPLPNGELLRRYGYVTENHARYDVVELPWELVEKRIQETLNIDQSAWESLKQNMDPEELEDGFVIERQSEDPDSTGQFQDQPTFAGLPEELIEQVKAFLKAAKKLVPDAHLEDKSRREEVLLQSILAALKDRGAQFGTGVDVDEQILAGTSLEDRRRMAILVRRGEKLLLREAQAWIQGRLEALRESGHDGEGPAAKRRKTKA